MPITVLHRAQGSEEALARAASDVGARSFWDRFLKSGLAGAQIMERRRGQERGIEAQREAQLRAADIRGAEREEVRRFAGEREAGLARSATSETGVEPLPGETSAGFLQRVQPDIGLAREAKVANAREVRRIEELEGQDDALDRFKEQMDPEEYAFQKQQVAMKIAKIPPRGKPPAPAEMFEKTTYTDPSTGAVIGFDPQTGKPFKLLDRPKPGEGADAPISREDFGKRFQVTLKRLQERAQLTKGQAATVKAVTAEDVVEEMRKEDEAFGRYQGGDPVEAYTGAAPQPGAQGILSGQAAPEVGLTGAAPAGEDISPRNLELMLRVTERRRVARRTQEPRFARAAARLRKEGVPQEEIEEQVIAQVLSDEELDRLVNQPEKYAKARAQHKKRFGE